MGNPLKSEGAAFRWLIAVIAGAVLVILVAVLMSSVAAALLGFIMLAVVSVFIVKGMAHMLSSPDGDDPDELDRSPAGYESPSATEEPPPATDAETGD